MRARLVGVVASGPLLALVVLVAGQATPGYSHLADTISHLASAGQPHAGVVRVAFALYGLLVIAGAGAVAEAIRERMRLLAALVGVYGGASIVAGLASKDPPGPVHTTASQVHVLATLVGGVALVGAMALVGRSAQDQGARRRAAVAAGATVLVAIVFRCTWGWSVYGLVERVLIAGAAAWLASLAVDRLRVTRRSTGSSR